MLIDFQLCGIHVELMLTFVCPKQSFVERKMFRKLRNSAKTIKDRNYVIIDFMAQHFAFEVMKS